MIPRLACLAFVLGGCTTQINQVSLGVATDLRTRGAAPQIDGLTVIIDGATTRSQAIGDGAKDLQLPGAVVVYTTGERLPTVEVAVVGTRAGATVIERRVRVTLRGEQTRFIRLALAARCIGVSCGDGQTCVEGACQPIDYDLGRALPYLSGQEFEIACDDPGFLSSFDDMPLPPPTGACGADQVCVEGTCYQPPGAPPIAGAGQFAIGSLGDFAVP